MKECLSPALLLETDYLEQTYNMVGTDLQITYFIARTQIWILTQLCTSLPVWLVHNRFPDSVPCTVDGGSGKSPEYFVTISTSSPEQTGIH